MAGFLPTVINDHRAADRVPTCHDDTIACAYFFTSNMR